MAGLYTSLGDLAFAALEKSAVQFNDVGLLSNDTGIGIPSAVTALPLILVMERLGFPKTVFSVPDDPLSLTSWEWSTFSFANRAVATNGGILQPNDIYVFMNVEANTADKMLLISGLMPMVINIINKYVARGGLFTVITPANIFFDCVFKKFEAINQETYPGQIFKFTFFKPLISANQLKKILPDSGIEAMENGGSLGGG